MKNVSKISKYFDGFCFDLCLGFISTCLQKEAKYRFSARETLEHSWIQNLPVNLLNFHKMTNMVNKVNQPTFIFHILLENIDYFENQSSLFLSILKVIIHFSNDKDLSPMNEIFEVKIFFSKT